MQLDTLAMERLVDAARPLLTGGQIRECVSTPDGQGLVIGIQTPRGLKALRFIVSPRYSHLALIDKLPKRVEAPDSHLVSVARRALPGLTIERLEVPPGERVLTLHLIRREFTGDVIHLKFIAELMGKHSNLLVVDEAGIIMAAWKVAHAYENRYREVRAGKPYRPPPPTGPHPMRALTETEWRSFFVNQPLDAKLQIALLNTFARITPGVIHVALDEMGWNRNVRLAEVLSEEIPRWTTVFGRLWIQIEAGEKLPPWDQWLDIHLEGEALHQAFAGLYDQWESEEREGDRAQQWRAAMLHRQSELDRLAGLFNEEKERHTELLAARKIGDLIYAHLAEFPPKTIRVEVTVPVVDLFDGGEIAITIPAGSSALKVARDAHAKASRAKRGIVEATTRMEAALQEKIDLEEHQLDWQQYVDLDAASWKQVLVDFRAGRQPRPVAPASGGRGKPTALPGRAALPQALKAHHIFAYRLPQGLTCYIGGNATGNEALWRYGDPEHLWLHVKGLPGSHVLIPAVQGQVPVEALEEAARLAASHSSVKEGTKIPVDYVQIRYLKKPPGSAAGYVTYTRERTLLVDPFNELELKRRRLS